MSNKRITDLTELTNPTTDDVLPIVDIATNTTQKVQVGNLPTTTAVTNALATKQDTLVSGTNIKTLNSTSLLGSGDIVLTANPSGVAGAIQFSNGSAFASDAANLFWDDTNKRLGIGTNAPTENVEVVKNAAANNKLLVSNTNTTTSTARASVEVKVGTLIGTISSISGSGVFVGSFSNDRLLLTTGGTSQANIQANGNFNFGNSVNDLGAKVGIKGSGSTSATTSLLVQNSAGTAALTITDDRNALFGNIVNANSFRFSSVSELGGNCRVTTTNPANPQERLFSAEGSASQTVAPTTSFQDIRNFTPTSGSALFTSFQYSGTINQTGGANGITRGLYINPTLTAAADFRAIQTTAGKIIFGGLPTSSAGLVSGQIWNDAGTIKIV